MRNIRVITDSACDLSTELVKKYGITVIPLKIVNFTRKCHYPKNFQKLRIHQQKPF